MSDDAVSGNRAKPEGWELNGVVYPINPDELTVNARFEVVLKSPRLDGHKYPILPGDVLSREADGTYMKHAPGLAVGGLEIPDEFIITWAEYDPSVHLTEAGF